MRAFLTGVVLVVAAACGTDAPTQSGTSTQHVDHPSGFPGAGGGWDNKYIPQRYGRFTISFVLNAFETDGKPIDGVVGLTNGPADGFSDLGPILRFNPSGTFDARDGGEYRAIATVPYRSEGQSDDAPFNYGVRMDVDLPNHVYSVWITPPHQPEVQIADHFAFRTEQQTLARIDQVAAEVDSATGSLLYMTATLTPPLCVTSNATSGWAGTHFPAQSGHFYFETDVVPDANNLDTVVGLSSGTPADFSSLGPIIRLNPTGAFDARDGDRYHASMFASYAAGNKYELFYDVDLTNHTFSAHVSQPDGGWPQIADNFAFRTEQGDVASLDTLGQFIDATPGSVMTCDAFVMPLDW